MKKVFTIDRLIEMVLGAIIILSVLLLVSCKSDNIVPGLCFDYNGSTIQINRVSDTHYYTTIRWSVVSKPLVVEIERFNNMYDIGMITQVSCLRFYKRGPSYE